MATRRVNGPIFYKCPRCHRQYGPFSRLTEGWTACVCGNRFYVNV